MRIVFRHEEIHLEQRFEVDHVEGGAAPDGLARPLLVDLEIRSERIDERYDMLETELRDEIRVIRRAGDAV
jgi:hypothetical protein